MRIERRSPVDEHMVITGMIMDNIVLAAVAQVWEPDLFGSRWANLIAKWCYDYYKKYKKAPRRHIEALFASWARKHEDQEKTVALVERFLGSLSTEYESRKENPNSAYVIDVAGDHFNRQKLIKLKNELEGALDLGDIERAEEIAASYREIELGEGSFINVFEDEAALDLTFQSAGKPIVKYPGHAGEFFNESLERDGFISFMGPEKSGKSWFLIDLAVRAIEQKNKVAFFAIGDLSDHQMMNRLLIRLSGLPAKEAKLKIPTEIYRLKNERRVEVFSEYQTRKILTPKAAQLAWKKYQTDFGTDPLKLSIHRNSTISTRGIGEQIERWIGDGWIPDVVVIDYADLLSPPPGYVEREAINQTWKELRSISQMLHCLLVTATQADARSYGKDMLTMANFSEDKRKNAHVTGMIGINPGRDQRGEAKEWKLNFVVPPRERESPPVLRVAGCLGIGNPIMVSIF